MGASPLMSVGLRAMAASYTAMQTTGHNIANANVEGFSRQSAQMATAKGQFTGAGFIGKGVDVKTVERAHDQFLTRAAAIARSMSSMDAARHDRLTQLENVFPTGESGVGYTTGQFLNALVDLASRPGDSATRQVVLARGRDLATRFNSAAGQLESLQAGVTEDLKASVTQINGLSRSIAKVNDEIAASRGLGQPPNDLLDERDRLVGQLAGLVDITTVAADDGTLGVFIAGGQRLVLGNDVGQLQVVPDAADSARASLGLKEGAGVRIIDPASLGGGSVAGLLRFQNHDLVDGRNLIGQLAAAIAGAVNAQQRLGVSLQQPLGSAPSQALFGLAEPRVVPASTNVRDASGGFAAEVRLTVVDPSQLLAADYDLRPDPAAPGTFQLTRLTNPPLSRSVVPGDVVDGLRIDFSGAPPATTDRFLLQPVGNAAASLSMLLEDPRDLAAASPLTALVDAANRGTAAVQSLTVVAPPPFPAGIATLSFTSDAGDYDWQVTDAGGALLAAGSGRWTPDEPVPTPPADINGFALRLSGAPRSGDVLRVVPTEPQFLAANNGNAQALSALRDALLVGRTLLADGSYGGGNTAGDAYASALADVGVRVQTAESSAAISGSVSAQAEQARSQTSGVNLDEEAAALIQYQQSYQAAAKVLQVAQSLFETLLQTAGA